MNERTRSRRKRFEGCDVNDVNDVNDVKERPGKKKVRTSSRAD